VLFGCVPPEKFIVGVVVSRYMVLWGVWFVFAAVSLMCAFIV